MPMVIVEGVFMGANLKTTTYEGNSKTSLYLDVYQPTSTESDKMVQLKTDEVDMLNTFNQSYDVGSKITVEAGVNAYKNKAYFKLLKVVA